MFDNAQPVRAESRAFSDHLSTDTTGPHKTTQPARAESLIFVLSISIVIGCRCDKTQPVQAEHLICSHHLALYRGPE